MAPAPENHYCTVPRLKAIPFLIHGFGTKNLTDSDILGIPEWRDFSLVSLRQVHSDRIIFINGPTAERQSGDALITDRPKVLLSVRTADCLPVFIVSLDPKAVAAVHCGWRGTCKGLIKKVVESMIRIYGCHPDSLFAALGPSIGAECYEVGSEIRECFHGQKAAFRFFRPHPHREEKYFFDLRGMNRFQLLEVGMRDQNIFSVDRCTLCEKKYFSYRRDKSEPGRMINFIGMSFP